MVGEQSNKELCLALIHAESEDEVVTILKKAGYWESPEDWTNFGRMENNFSTIGAQQSSADSALVEKLINSVDAVLTKECLIRGIKPESKEAPPSITAAVEEFFDIRDGKLTDYDPYKRGELANNVQLVATGEKKSPNFMIIDLGEGQSPNRMEDTFLSLNKSNKIKVQFVQGKHNMGGTGVLRFCSDKYHLQLIVSKRAPEIAKSENDPTSDSWGFTIVRRDAPPEGMKSSIYRYLAPDKKILSFRSADLDVLPGKKPYEVALPYGSCVKLYEYKLEGGLKTVITLDLYYRLSALMPSIGLPIRLVEMRDYGEDRRSIVLSGLNVRLQENKSDNIEEKFPSYDKIIVNGKPISLQIWAFKREKGKKDSKRKKYSQNDGVIFTYNGQAQGGLTDRFFERSKIGYVKDSILVMVDCSALDWYIVEDIFMNSRDRLLKSEIMETIKSELTEKLREHPGLKALQEERKREDIEGKLSESKPLKEILQKIVNRNPALTNFLLHGTRINIPFNTAPGGTQPEFKGEEFPKTFQLKKGYPSEAPKLCPINKRPRIIYTTDANNDYFDRDSNSGHYEVKLNGETYGEFVFNLWEGIATLSGRLPAGAKIGDKFEFEVTVSDESRDEPFVSTFNLEIAEAAVLTDNPPRPTPKLPGDNKDEKTDNPSSAALPEIIGYRESEEDWSGFFTKKDDALFVKGDSESGYVFYVNLSNTSLLSELKFNKKTDVRLQEERYKISMGLLGLSAINYCKLNSDDADDDDSEVNLDKVSAIANAVSPVILPLISSMYELDLSDLEEQSDQDTQD